MTTLIADLVAQQQIGEEPGQHTTEKAKQLLAQILLPKQITGKLIEKYIRKAMRTGAWRKLPPQTKALLFLAKKFVKFKSPMIVQIFRQILTYIELTTTRGKALFYGIILIFKKSYFYLYGFFITSNVDRIFTLGINYLNKPLQYRPI